MTVQYFYDGPKPALDADNPFKKFLDIPHTLLTRDGAGAGMEQTSSLNANTSSLYANTSSSYTSFDEILSYVNESDCDVFDLDFDKVGPKFDSATSDVAHNYSNDSKSDFRSDSNIYETRSQAHPRRAMAGVMENSWYVRSHHKMLLSQYVVIVVDGAMSWYQSTPVPL